MAGQVAEPNEGRRRAPGHDAGQGAPSLPVDCAELHAIAFAGTLGEDGKLALPKWVHLSPNGDEGHELALEGERVVRGRDGREFAIGDVKRVMKGTELPMQFDWDHESVSWFGSTKAAGWIDKIIHLEEGDEERPAAGFWGRVERWTPEGRASVEDGYFRGLSPVVRYEYRQPSASDEPSPPPLLVGFVNVALTNRPNLKMTLLNHEGHQPRERAEENGMDDDLEELARELGLSPKASHKSLGPGEPAQRSFPHRRYAMLFLIFQPFPLALRPFVDKCRNPPDVVPETVGDIAEEKPEQGDDGKRQQDHRRVESGVHGLRPWRRFGNRVAVRRRVLLALSGEWGRR